MNDTTVSTAVSEPLPADPERVRGSNDEFPSNPSLGTNRDSEIVPESDDDFPSNPSLGMFHRIESLLPTTLRSPDIITYAHLRFFF